MSKMSDSVHNANSAPINIVENTLDNYNVVQGARICTAVVTVPYKYIKNIEALPPQVWGRTLLDSGSDGDLLFIKKSKLKNIPYENRYAAKP